MYYKYLSFSPNIMILLLLLIIYITISSHLMTWSTTAQYWEVLWETAPSTSSTQWLKTFEMYVHILLPSTNAENVTDVLCECGQRETSMKPQVPSSCLANVSRLTSRRRKPTCPVQLFSSRPQRPNGLLLLAVLAKIINIFGVTANSTFTPQVLSFFISFLLYVLRYYLSSDPSRHHGYFNTTRC